MRQHFMNTAPGDLAQVALAALALRRHAVNAAALALCFLLSYKTKKNQKKTNVEI